MSPIYTQEYNKQNEFSDAFYRTNLGYYCACAFIESVTMDNNTLFIPLLNQIMSDQPFTGLNARTFKVKTAKCAGECEGTPA